MTPSDASLIDSRYAAWRLLVTLILVTLGNGCMWVISVVLPAVQAEFGVGRGDATMPYVVMMLAVGIGGLITGRLADRHGIMAVLWLGAAAIGAGFVWAGMASSLWSFSAAHILLGLIGSSATFAPLMADTALWWNRRRGIAVAICACGNYIAGAVWPPLIQWGVETVGWRQAYVWCGLVSALGIAVLSLAMRRRPPLAVAVVMPCASAAGQGGDSGMAGASQTERPFGLSARHAQILLCIAGVACCVAMSMPQVHIVAYCADLGFGASTGAQMLSVMLVAGIVSRLVSGWICDHIGGLRTLLLGAVLQGVALLMFLPADTLVSLYVVSALFGLFQGGLIPAYAIVIREYFPPEEVGLRVGAVVLASLLGMALGGWMSGWLFDLTGSYRAAFINGIAWNLVTLTIAAMLLWRVRQARTPAVAAI